jgi:hypothetical protein
MPTLAEHRATAKRFLELYYAIPEDHPEGRVLALFYSALHHVEAVAAASGKDCRTHRQREDFIQKNHIKMWKFYRPLWAASEQARYLAGGAFTMNSEAVENFLRKKHHHALEQWSAAMLGLPPETKPPESPKPSPPTASERPVGQSPSASSQKA